MKKKVLTAFVLLGLAFVSTAQKTPPTTQKNVSIAQKRTYTIGLNPALGGYVFQLSADKMHGLVAETKDQGVWTWYAAKEIQKLSCVHTLEGVKFSDWRLPTMQELNKIYIQRSAIGGFANYPYWSSTEYTSPTKAYILDFSSGTEFNQYKAIPEYVRVVRAF